MVCNQLYTVIAHMFIMLLVYTVYSLYATCLTAFIESALSISCQCWFIHLQVCCVEDSDWPTHHSIHISLYQNQLHIQHFFEFNEYICTCFQVHTYSELSLNHNYIWVYSWKLTSLHVGPHSCKQYYQIHTNIDLYQCYCVTSIR